MNISTNVFSDLISDLVPMILGSALAPIWIIIVLLILPSRNGLLKACAFVAGTTVIRLLQGLIFGYILGPSAVEGDPPGSSPVVSVLLMVLGILLLIAAIKKLINQEDPDAPPPKWMTGLDQATAPALFGLGAMFTLIAPKLWVFTLSAIGVILSANLSSSQALKTFLLYLLVAEALMILPLLLHAMVPRQSASLLESASNWLMRYNNQITLIASLVFGSLFLWKGVSGLRF